MKLRSQSLLFMKHYMAQEGDLNGVEEEFPKSADVHALLEHGFTRLDYTDLMTIVINDVLGPHLNNNEIGIGYAPLAKRLAVSEAN